MIKSAPFSTAGKSAIGWILTDGNTSDVISSFKQGQFSPRSKCHTSLLDESLYVIKENKLAGQIPQGTR